MTRILVYEWASAGALAAEPALAGEMMAMGRAMRDAVAHDFAHLAAVRLSVADCAQAPWQGPGQALRQPCGADPLASLSRMAQAHDAVLALAPESSGKLAAVQAAVAPHARWLGASAEAIAVASSKRRTLAVLDAAGLPTPLRADVAAAAVHWVHKPDDGAGCVATWRLNQPREPDPGHTVEPWVEGQAISLGLWVAPGQTRLLAVNRQHIHVADDGAVSYQGLAPMGTDAALAALGSAITAAIPGLAGYVGVDCVDSAVFGPVVIEVNPRVTCGYVGLSARLGHDLGRWWLR